eukprot:CAMPEP_0184746864 /NCGR_PEP_ID=MMETSP0315-20130426/9358_1 /TAXON_ID=101924 /ORGANISM="Rhodosorus marinus, Strain UTEX LB 2760" /LENGTH=551 /DNA_ID=CAMNT_0027219611 /DNA_START=242 /DNA_END=1897 /DNA_ORIENTATION=-
MPNNLVVGGGRSSKNGVSGAGSAFLLFALGKTFRALAAFAAFHALRSHHLPALLFLFIATAGAALSVVGVQRPWNGKPISSQKVSKLVVGGIILAVTLALWTLGLRECGPLRTLVMDGAEMPLYYLFSIYTNREKADKRRTRGTVLIIVAYLLLMFDATNRAPSGHGLLQKTRMGRELDEKIVRFKNGTLAKLYEFKDVTLNKSENDHGDSRRRLLSFIEDPEKLAKLESAKMHVRRLQATEEKADAKSAEDENEVGNDEAGEFPARGKGRRFAKDEDVDDEDDDDDVHDGDGGDDGDDGEEDEDDEYVPDEDYEEDIQRWDDDPEDEDYEDVTDEYYDYDYEDEYDYPEEYDAEKELDAPRFKDKAKVMRTIGTEEIGQFRKPHRVIGVLLVVASSVITQASRGYTRHVATEIGGAKRYFSLSLATASGSLLIPGALAYYFSKVPVHLTPISLGQFLLVGFLWLVFPYYIRSIVSTKLNSRILLQAGVLFPFVIAAIASVVFGFGASAGGVSFLLLISFALSSIGFKLVMADMRHGPELPTADSKSSDKD